MDDPRSGTGNFRIRKKGQAGPQEVQTDKSKFSLPATSRARRDRYAGED